MSEDELERQISELKGINRNWTGSEEASAVLLEEMRSVAVCRFGHWWQIIKHHTCSSRRLTDGWLIIGFEGEKIGEDEDRKTAIAKAWLAWKKSIVEAAHE